jgi:Ras-related protein Rab-8A
VFRARVPPASPHAPLSQANRNFNHLVKLLLIGDSAVGKSCLLLRYSDDHFSSSFITTIGIDFKIKSVEVEGKKIKLQIWDTAGQERFRTITTAYYRGAMGIILVYDVTNETSFNNVRNWMRQIDQHASDTVRRILVANKCDVPAEQRKVSEEQGRALAAEFDVPFFEASAKENLNVSDVFMTITKEIVARLEAAPAAKASSGGTQLKTASGGKSQCC